MLVNVEVKNLPHDADFDPQDRAADASQVRDCLKELRPKTIYLTAALTHVDYCEDHRVEAMRLNADAPRVLAEICRKKHARFIHVSTDYVFDGEKRVPYTEEDPAHAISVYGESKRVGELHVLEANDHALVIRVSWVFGPDRPSFIDAILKKAQTVLIS
jgi:dTDP-4-dehydrorhamnose reductase